MFKTNRNLLQLKGQCDINALCLSRTQLSEQKENSDKIFLQTLILYLNTTLHLSEIFYDSLHTIHQYLENMVIILKRL